MVMVKYYKLINCLPIIGQFWCSEPPINIYCINLNVVMVWDIALNGYPFSVFCPRDVSWRCWCWFWCWLVLCCPPDICIWLQQVTVGEADVVEHSAADNDLWHKPHIHLQGLQEDGAPSRLQYPKGPLHNTSPLTGSSCSVLGGGCGDCCIRRYCGRWTGSSFHQKSRQTE